MSSFIHDFRGLLERGEDLPTLPDVVFELHAAFEREDVDHAELVAIIERDPALMTRLLRAANSPVYRRGDPVVDVHVAIQRMGMRNVRATWIVLGVVQSFEGLAGGLDHRAFWNHAAAVGLTAQRIWRRAKFNRFGDDQLYIAGLLHDVGLLVLDQFFPERMQEAAEVAELGGEPRPAVETLVLGMDHGTIGGLLLGSWSLPDVIVNAVSHHHDTVGSPAEFAEVSQTVCAAEHLCGRLGLGLGLVHEVNPECRESFPLVSPDVVEAVGEELEELRETESFSMF